MVEILVIPQKPINKHPLPPPDALAVAVFGGTEFKLKAAN